VVVNLNKSESMKNVTVQFSKEALAFLRVDSKGGSQRFTEKLSDGPALAASPKELVGKGLEIKEIPALTPYFFEITQEKK
ncbi:MAG: hypothetical protein WCH43_17285, partial [Verrucomicrobiota bacterium]